MRPKKRRGAKAMTKEIIAELKKIVGKDYVMDMLEDRICYSFDATFRDSCPDVVVKPANTGEIVKVMQLAHRHGIPVTAMGAATGNSGGAVPLGKGICLGLTRLNRILKIDVENRMAIVEPGVITDDFANAVLRTGLLFYPPDPASSKISTIGGNIVECAGGPRGVKYGITRDYVLGLEVVLSDGRVVEVGNQADGDMCGPDWTMLFVGSEGTLGIVTKMFLRLAERPEAKQTILAVYDRLDDAANTVSAIIKSGTIPTTLEIMDNQTIRVVEDYLKAGLPVEADAVLLIEVDGSKVEVERQKEHVINVCRKCGASDVQVAVTNEDIDRLWLARRSISPACGKVSPTKFAEDTTVPRSKVPEMLRKAREIADKHGIKMLLFGHAGDGNLHPNIMTNRHNHAEMEKVELAVKDLFRAALELGGTLSGEHGIGYMKAPFLKWELGEVGFEAGQKVKAALDPAHLLNPGKMFTA
jgi:glycolate oxidase